MAGPENRPLGASAHKEMAELAGHVLANPLDITPRQAQSLAGCVLALFDQRVDGRKVKAAFRKIRGASTEEARGAELDRLEVMLFPPKPVKAKAT